MNTVPLKGTLSSKFAIALIAFTMSERHDFQGRVPGKYRPEVVISGSARAGRVVKLPLFKFATSMAGDEGMTVAEHIGAKQVNRPAVARESKTRMLNAATTLFSWGRHEYIEAAPTRIPPLH